MCTDSSLLPNVDKLRFASTVQDYSVYTAHDGRDPGGSIQVPAEMRTMMMMFHVTCLP